MIGFDDKEPVVPSSPEFEASRDPIDALLTRLDFYELVESADAKIEAVGGTGVVERLANVRAEVMAVLQEQPDNIALRREAWSAYADLSEQIVDSLDDQDKTGQERYDIRARAQIGFAIHKAHIYREVGNIERFIEELDDVEIYARRAGHEAFSQSVQQQIDNVIDTISPSPLQLLMKSKQLIGNDVTYEELRDQVDVVDLALMRHYINDIIAGYPDERTSVEFRSLNPPE